MNKKFNGFETVGEIVAEFPKAGEVFKKFKIDFCCGGHRKLSEVAAEQNLDLEKVIEELNVTYNQTKEISLATDWRVRPMSELIDHIVDTHHVYLQEELPALSSLINKILRVHGFEDGEMLTKVHKLFSMLRMELEQHLIKEEEFLFPLIKMYEKKQSPDTLEKAIKVMKETEDEHEGAGDILKELRRVTDDFTVPMGGCGTYRITFSKLEDLEQDLFRHIHLENNILFKRLVEGK